MIWRCFFSCLSLSLGTFHGIWHLPALFTPLLGPFTVDGFIVFVLTAAAGTFIYTWVFNNTRGSVWMAMLLHASSNAASQLVSSLIPKDVELTGWMKTLESGWLNVIVFGLVALLLILFTRARWDTNPIRQTTKTIRTFKDPASSVWMII